MILKFCFTIAIRLGNRNVFEELSSLISEFVERNKFQEAHDLYVCLMDQFPDVSELKFELVLNGNLSCAERITALLLIGQNVINL